MPMAVINRRYFLSLLSAVPFVGRFVPAPPPLPTFTAEDVVRMFNVPAHMVSGITTRPIHEDFLRELHDFRHDIQSAIAKLKNLYG